MLDLDVKDRKLVYYLSQNARMSHAQLSDRVGLSKNSVKYRIDRLMSEGVLKNFATTINLGALGLTTYCVFLRFNEDVYENKRIIDYFKNHGFVDWAVTLSGQWDFFVEFVAEDIGHLTEIVNGLIEEFGESLNTYQLFSSNNPLRVEHLIEDFYRDLNLPPLERKERSKKIEKLDSTDRKILRLLSSDASLNYLAIADKLNLTIDVVRYRMKNMVDSGIIIKFFSEISLPKLGYTEYLYRIRLKNISVEEFDKIKMEIQNNSNVTYAFVDINTASIVLVCAFLQTEKVDEFSRGLRKKYAGVIDEQEYLIIKEQVLFDLFPKGLLGL